MAGVILRFPRLAMQLPRVDVRLRPATSSPRACSVFVLKHASLALRPVISANASADAVRFDGKRLHV